MEFSIYGCSKCFRNEGLSREAEKLGIKNNEKCSYCGSTFGAKLTKDQLANLAKIFFEQGSLDINQVVYGENYMLTGIGEVNFVHYFNENFDIKREFDESLHSDIKFLQDQLNFQFNWRSPRSWDCGITDLWFEMKEIIEQQKEPYLLDDNENTIIDRIIDSRKSITLQKGVKLYRIRTNITEKIDDPESYDSPPLTKKKSRGRFECFNLPVLYTAYDIETCIHECKTTVYDEIVVATLEVKKPIIILNMEEEIENCTDSNANIQCYLNSMSFSREYEGSQLIAKRVYERGYCGINYLSYFSMIRDRKYSNVVIFGHPIKEKTLELISLNRIRFNKIQYDFTYGPIK